MKQLKPTKKKPSPRKPLRGRKSAIEAAARRDVVNSPAKAAAGFDVALRYLADGLVDVDAVVAELGITKASLATSLGFAEETFQRFSRVNAPKTQERLREFLEIITRVEPWAGGVPQALGWYRGYSIAALGDQTAEALVKHDQAAVVRTYLDAYAAGAHA
jgi:hypothetical protein